MGRRAKVVKSARKHLMIPEDIVAKVELELWSEVEGKVPLGAWQALQVELLTEWLARRQGARNEQQARELMAAQKQALGIGKFSAEV